MDENSLKQRSNFPSHKQRNKSYHFLILFAIDEYFTYRINLGVACIVNNSRDSSKVNQNKVQAYLVFSKLGDKEYTSVFFFSSFQCLIYTTSAWRLSQWLITTSSCLITVRPLSSGVFCRKIWPCWTLRKELWWVVPLE